MSRHKECDNLVLLAVFLEIPGRVALMAVNNYEAVCTHSPRLCMLIKVLYPGESKLIRCPAARADLNNPVGRDIVEPG